MGILNRHAGAPFIDGETLPASDLETDLARAFAEIAGNIDDDNLATDADLNGSKLAAGSLLGSRIVSGGLATDRLDADSLAEVKLTEETIQTERIAAGAASGVQTDDVTADAALTATDATLASVTITTGSTSQGVAILAFASAEWNTPTSGVSLSQEVILSVDRDTSQLREWTSIRGIKDRAVPSLFIFTDETVATSTLYTYTLKGRLGGATLGGFCRDAVLVALDLRR